MTPAGPQFALVVPTLNEAGNIRLLLERAVAALSQTPVSWSIIVVDDDSKDGTGDIVREYASTDNRVRLVTRTGCRGLAGAITYGWAQTDADLLGVIDADLQHPPELLPVLISALRDFDLAIASRYVRSRSMHNWSLVRRVISRLSLLASAPLQKPALMVKDSMSGFFVLRRECISGVTFQATGFKLLLEVLSRGHVGSVTEVPFTFEPRQHGKSKANAMTALHYFSLLCRLCFNQIRNTEHGSDRDNGSKR
jgi:dolichol-phosphate mannosyltransferase